MNNNITDLKVDRNINPGKKQCLRRSHRASGKKIVVKGKIQVKNKDEKCVYCDKPGIHYRELQQDWMCASRIYDCKGFIEHWSSLLKEAQNRKEVKEKKRIAMVTLHNSDCEPCKEFQENYIKGRELFNNHIYKRYYNLLIKYGISKDNIPMDYNERKKLALTIKRHRKEIGMLRGDRKSMYVRTKGSLTIN